MSTTWKWRAKLSFKIVGVQDWNLIAAKCLEEESMISTNNIAVVLINDEQRKRNDGSSFSCVLSLCHESTRIKELTMANAIIS